MRARGAILRADLRVELREILLRDKPPAFRAASPSATVPALQLADRVIDESLDIMVWALEQSDPDGLLDMPEDGWSLIEANDGPFKTALDHTKYAARHPDRDACADRAEASLYLQTLDVQLKGHPALFGAHHTLADHAIWPFVRQFANTDRAWFNAQPWPNLITWLDGFTHGPAFAHIMTKYAPWTDTDTPVFFSKLGP